MQKGAVGRGPTLGLAGDAGFGVGIRFAGSGHALNTHMQGCKTFVNHCQSLSHATGVEPVQWI